MNDYLIIILGNQRHEEILTEFKAVCRLQPEPPHVSRGTGVSGILRHLFRQLRRPIAYRQIAVADERNGK